MRQRPTHECQCQDHDCRVPVSCRDLETCGAWRGRQTPHICDFCEVNADCNGSALNPSPNEYHSFLSGKL
jgi:hypothetical protein